MAKIDKYTQARLDGMASALIIAKQDGIEGLERECKRRGIFPYRLSLDRKEMERAYSVMAQTMLATTKTIYAWAAHKVFGAGEIRLKRFMRMADDLTVWCHTVDEFGTKYDSYRDIAKTLNGKYGLHIDYDTVEKVEIRNDNAIGVNKMRLYVPAAYWLLHDDYPEAAKRLADFIPGAWDEINKMEHDFDAMPTPEEVEAFLAKEGA